MRHMDYGNFEADGVEGVDADLTDETLALLTGQPKEK